MRIMKAHVLVYAPLLCLPPFCLANNTLKMGQNLQCDNNDSLVSKGDQFELGFFTPPRNPNRYLGIWYHNKHPQTLVWVANRDKPIPPSKAGIFHMSQDGNLIISDAEGNLYWSCTPAQVASSPENIIVKLMDSGNLILGDDQLQTTYWQSFDHPTDTFLLGMNMKKGIVLNSWRSHNDPRSGNFTFSGGKEVDSNYTIYSKHNQFYWACETRQDFGSEGEILWLLTNFTMRPSTYKNKTISISPPPRSDFESARLVLNHTGQIELWRWDDIGGWTTSWEEPNNKCKIYNLCGNFASCNSNNIQLCRCLPGFTSKSPGENHIPSHKYGGFSRKTTSCGRNTTTFAHLKNVKVRKPDKKVYAANETNCQSMCLNGTGCPSCTAYSYDASTVYSKTFFPCSIWTSSLPSLQEEIDLGFNLSIPVNKPDIETTPRTCRPCGVFTIPYPLSTEPSCGDPSYSSYGGQVSFNVGDKSYRVTNIEIVLYSNPWFGGLCCKKSRASASFAISCHSTVW